MKNNIKLAREKKGLTQKECADQLGITLRAWQTYEQGISEPKQSILCQIADMLCVSLDYLLGREKAHDPFAELDLSADDEQEVFAKYMSLPENVRAVVLDVLFQLGQAHHTADTPDIVETTTAGALHDRLEAATDAEETAG